MMKHKLAQVMLERNASKRLKGNVQMDDAYIGGARSGRRAALRPERVVRRCHGVGSLLERNPSKPIQYRIQYSDQDSHI